jgi:hypothetical protein
MIKDAAGERSEPAAFRSKSPVSSNAVLGNVAQDSSLFRLSNALKGVVVTLAHGGADWE